LPGTSGRSKISVDFNIGPLADAVPCRHGGEVHRIAVSSDGRHPLAPDVPALAELGVGEMLSKSCSIWAPGLPGPLRDRLRGAIRTANEHPPVTDLLVNRFSFDVAARLGAMLRADLDAVDAVWAPRLGAASRQ
jgi:tripartite-type tricarboxylate transporter receptor subunit TctC